MKTFAVLAMVAGAILMSGQAYADQYGAPEPTTKVGEFALSAGHTYYDSKWKSSDFRNSINVSQSRIFIQGNYSPQKNWEGYIRGGAANFRSKDFYDDALGGLFGFTGFGNFNDNYQPYAAVGIKGLFYTDGIFGLGAFAQGTYQFAEYKSTVFFGQNNSLDFRFKNPWDITMGIAGQVKVMGITFYGGPLAYWTGARVEFEGIQAGTPSFLSTRPHENNHVGGFFGLKAPLYKRLSIMGEVQYKSDFSIGGSVVYSF